MKVSFVRVVVSARITNHRYSTVCTMMICSQRGKVEHWLQNRLSRGAQVLDQTLRLYIGMYHAHFPFPTSTYTHKDMQLKIEQMV